MSIRAARFDIHARPAREEHRSIHSTDRLPLATIEDSVSEDSDSDIQANDNNNNNEDDQGDDNDVDGDNIEDDEGDVDIVINDDRIRMELAGQLGNHSNIPDDEEDEDEDDDDEDEDDDDEDDDDEDDEDDVGENVSNHLHDSVKHSREIRDSNILATCYAGPLVDMRGRRARVRRSVLSSPGSSLINANNFSKYVSPKSPGKVDWNFAMGGKIVSWAEDVVAIRPRGVMFNFGSNSLMNSNAEGKAKIAGDTQIEIQTQPGSREEINDDDIFETELISSTSVTSTNVSKSGDKVSKFSLNEDEEEGEAQYDDDDEDDEDFIDDSELPYESSKLDRMKIQQLASPYPSITPLLEGELESLIRNYWDESVRRRKCLAVPVPNIIASEIISGCTTLMDNILESLVEFRQIVKSKPNSDLAGRSSGAWSSVFNIATIEGCSQKMLDNALRRFKASNLVRTRNCSKTNRKADSNEVKEREKKDNSVDENEHHTDDDNNDIDDNNADLEVVEKEQNETPMKIDEINKEQKVEFRQDVRRSKRSRKS